MEEEEEDQFLRWKHGEREMGWAEPGEEEAWVCTATRERTASVQWRTPICRRELWNRNGRVNEMATGNGFVG